MRLYAVCRRVTLAWVLAATALGAASHPAAARPAKPPAAADVPHPYGFYVVNEAGNGRLASKAYATGFLTSPAYLQHVTGHAIFVPLGKVLTSTTPWGQFTWNWAYMDTLVRDATSNGKKFSIEFETAIQNVGTNYLKSLPADFASSCGANCAPLFDVWVVGAGGTCSSSYVPIPWNPRIQQFWTLAADSLAAHLHAIGAYGSLTMVHVPGLSVYDEELRLPTGNPTPTPADTQPCPDGYPAYPTCITDADTTVWKGYGYSDSAVVHGFGVIANAFAQAFPDRELGLSLFPEGHVGRAFPNLTADTSGAVTSQLIQEVSAMAPGRVQIQADDLDIGGTSTEALAFAPEYHTSIGWQTNKHAGTGATCAGDTCGPDGEDSPYYQLLQTGSGAGGRYIEVWSQDVVNYPTSFAEADSAGFFSVAAVPARPGASGLTRLIAVAPNPARGRVRVSFELGAGSAPGATTALRLVIVDVAGRRIRSLPMPGLAAGLHTCVWDGRTQAGLRAHDGVYYAELERGATRLGRSRFVVLR